MLEELKNDDTSNMLLNMNDDDNSINVTIPSAINNQILVTGATGATDSSDCDNRDKHVVSTGANSSLLNAFRTVNNNTSGLL